jgi:hypothetical protein
LRSGARSGCGPLRAPYHTTPQGGVISLLTRPASVSSDPSPAITTWLRRRRVYGTRARSRRPRSKPHDLPATRTRGRPSGGLSFQERPRHRAVD